MKKQFKSLIIALSLVGTVFGLNACGGGGGNNGADPGQGVDPALTLTSLTVSVDVNGDIQELELNPTFDPQITEYEVNTGFAEAVLIAATANEANANISLGVENSTPVQGSAEFAHEIDLANPVDVIVELDGETQIYSIGFNKQVAKNFIKTEILETIDANALGGTSIAVSKDGNTLVVGEPGFLNNLGKVKVYERTEQGF